MNGFRTDLDGLTRSAGELHDLAGQADRIAEQLRRAQEAGAGCWGADEVGQRFAAKHEPRAQEAADAVGGIAGSLRGLGGKFAESAATSRAADDAGAAELGRSGQV
ncbi:hypothetical protein GIY23_18980 [Allosaccharopolyspora coralli]|uniref:WXG100 family type VII secretion target n=1 Tax=Allosaccharopolyspora coralli TaxID=2665642 RepID=A0A5Q3QIH1_9PSEU|nr:hypothetical protein [Allosaccharopolyspora coralli]QGK71325.1 hypothetical protein GIY23_18980 [Allosaccharopolyspora coralli]